MTVTAQAILAIIQLFFGSNPTVEEVEAVALPLLQAFSAAKAGQAFSLSIPVTIDGVKGSLSASWSPLPKATA